MLASRNFLQNEKILFLAKVITFLNLENTGNYSLHMNFNHNSLKINFKNLSSPTNFELDPLNLVVMF